MMFKLFDKELSDITKSDLDTLVENARAETQYIEYKELLKDKADSGKTNPHKEFACDVASIANANGGYILIGIKEDLKDKVAKEIIGLSENPDKYKLKLLGIIADYICPLLKINIQEIPIDENKYVFIIQIPNSYLKPHAANGRFYIRTENRKIEMDIANIRDMFLHYDTEQKMIDFVNNRIQMIQNGKTPTVSNYAVEPMFVIHALPLSSFLERKNYNLQLLKPLSQFNDAFITWIGTGGYHPKTNAEGFIIGDVPENKKQYKNEQFLVMRNGVIESIGFKYNHFQLAENGAKFILWNNIKVSIEKFIQRTKTCYGIFEINEPIIFFMKILNIKDYKLNTENIMFGSGEMIQYNDIDCGSIEITELTDEKTKEIVDNWINILFQSVNMTISSKE